MAHTTAAHLSAAVAEHAANLQTVAACQNAWASSLDDDPGASAFWAEELAEAMQLANESHTVWKATRDALRLGV